MKALLQSSEIWHKLALFLIGGALATGAAFFARPVNDERVRELMRTESPFVLQRAAISEQLTEQRQLLQSIDQRLSRLEGRFQ